jgi:hypothetical protein
MLECPECGKKYTKATGLGSHRRSAHGIKGQSKSTTYEHNKKKTRKYMRRNAKPIKTSPSKKQNNRKTIGNEEATVLITVGKFIAICEAIANSHNIPTKQFTERCATVFYASQVR